MKKFLLAILVVTRISLYAQTTSFSYQGSLSDGGKPAAGIYDLQFTVYDAVTNGAVVGTLQTNSAVAVSNGIFTVSLNFGATVFSGSPRWLGIGVRTNGSTNAFTLLSPNQLITSVPYSIQSLNAATAGLAANVTGAISDSQLSTNIGRLNASQTFSGTPNFNPFVGAPFTVGNVNKVANLNADLLDGLDSTAFWKRSGNAGTVPGTDFIGTTDNQALEFKANSSRALRLEPNSSGAPNVIGGAPVNFVSSAVGATVAGGGATNYFGVSYTNSVGGNFATVGGGRRNVISSGATAAVISGGSFNSIQSFSDHSFIGGGNSNLIYPNVDYAFIGGGATNTIYESANLSFIGGGYNNSIQSLADSSAIGGGELNLVQTNADFSFIGGGVGNWVEISASVSTIGGGYVNTIQSNAYSSFIGGGEFNFIQTNADQSFIGGGTNNSVGTGAATSTIGGGYANSIETDAYASFIGGGAGNAIQTNSYYSTISGGVLNLVQAEAPYSTIGGGFYNWIQGSAEGSTIAGGYNHTVQSGAYYSFIGGGSDNTILTNAFYSTIAGGVSNVIQAGTHYSTIGGGYRNKAGATVTYSTIPGGYSNIVSGDFCFAAGTRANANHKGAFVWADSNDADFMSSAVNQFSIRASGGTRIFSNTGATVGVQLAAGGNAWSAMSDRNVKENFKAVDAKTVLAKVCEMPITEWNLISQPTDIRHIGPMAQDFKAAFNVGEDDRHISTTDADGVAFAVIQGLNQKVEEQTQSLKDRDAKITKLQRDNEALQKRLERLERLLAATNQD